MINLFVEAVVMSFLMGGMLGAMITLHVRRPTVNSEEGTVKLVRRRSRI